MCKSEHARPTHFQSHLFLSEPGIFRLVSCLGVGLGRVKKFFCSIACISFLQNMSRTLFIVARGIVGMVVGKRGISGLSQSVSCPFADRQAFSVQFRSMDGGEKMCLGDRF